MTTQTFERVVSRPKPPHYVSLVGEVTQRTLANIPIGKRNIAVVQAIADRMARLWNAGEMTDGIPCVRTCTAFEGRFYRLYDLSVEVLSVFDGIVTWKCTDGNNNRRTTDLYLFERYAVEVEGK